MRYFLYISFLFQICVQGLLGQALVTIPPLVDSSKNIIGNTTAVARWDSIAQKLLQIKSKRTGQVTILHLGDSHIQGGYFPNRFRELLNDTFGVSGRGWVFPYRLAKVNGPEDVRFRSNSHWRGVKYNHLPTGLKASLAGYHLSCTDTVVGLLLKLKQGSESLYPFNEVEIYHNKQNLTCNGFPDAATVQAHGPGGLFVTRIGLPSHTDSLNIQFSYRMDSSDFLLSGLVLKSTHPGILNHSIGINGASYDSYLRFINYQPMLSGLNPQLVIVSLGTNDAYMGQVDSLRFSKRVADFTDSIRAVLPGVCILLTTPGDHLKGRKYLNPNIDRVRKSIIEVAIQKQCLYWDFLAVMGGPGASKRWYKNRLMFPDMMHLSQDGYKLQGELFFDAFLKSINQTIANGRD